MQSLEPVLGVAEPPTRASGLCGEKGQSDTHWPADGSGTQEVPRPQVAAVDGVVRELLQHRPVHVLWEEYAGWEHAALAFLQDPVLQSRPGALPACPSSPPAPSSPAPPQLPQEAPEQPTSVLGHSPCSLLTCPQSPSALRTPPALLTAEARHELRPLCHSPALGLGTREH